MATQAAFQDGDTHVRNGVTYVRQGGRWVAQGGSAPVLTPLTPPDPTRAAAESRAQASDARAAASDARAADAAERERVRFEREQAELNQYGPRGRRQLPQSAANTLGEAATGVLALDRAVSGFNDEYAGNTVTGGLENTIQRRVSDFGSPGQEQWWADIQSTDNVLRHALFGASLTAGEAAAWNRTTVAPEMDPAQVRANLVRRQEIARAALRRIARTQRANGFNEDAIRESLGELQNEILNDPPSQETVSQALAPVQAGVAAASEGLPAAPGGPATEPPSDPRAAPPGTHLQFWDEPAPPPASEGSRTAAALAAEAQAMFDRGATRAELDALARRMGGGPFGADLDQAIRYRDRGGRGARIVPFEAQPAPEVPEERAADYQVRITPLPGGPTLSLGTQDIDAAVRGGADVLTLGLADELAAMGDTVASGGTYAENLGRQRGIDDYDTQNNFYARTGGQLAAGFALPGAAASGLGRQAAFGGAFGTGYGFGSGEGDIGDRVETAIVGGGVGAFTPVALRGGRAAFSRLGASNSPRPAETMVAADRQGIELLPADVGGPMTRRFTAGAAQLPFAAGPIVRRAEKAAAQAGTARDRAAATVGEAAGTEGGGNAARRGARSFVARTSQRANQLYRTAEAEAGDAKITPTNSWDVLDRHIAELSETPGGAEGLGTLQALRQELNGTFTVAGMRRMRTALRDRFIQSGLRGSDLERRVGEVVEAASEDVANGLGAQGKGDAATAYRVADRYWRNRLRTIDDTLEPILGNNRSGEEIVSALNRAAQGNAERLSSFINALPEEEAGIVRSTIISQIGRPTAGTDVGQTFSFNQFLTEWNRMTPRARRVLFDGEALESLEDIATVARGARQSANYANRSNTGGAGNVASALTGFGTSGLSIPIEMISGRLLASPAFARWLAGSTRARKPQRHIGMLANIAARNPAIAQEVLGLQRALSAVNDNVGGAGRAAASPRQDEADH
jgi:hypothetical protein